MHDEIHFIDSGFVQSQLACVIEPACPSKVQQHFHSPRAATLDMPVTSFQTFTEFLPDITDDAIRLKQKL